ncbi:MAG: DUF4358 domain-containing protein [Oscillospiraceae bacterium]|nr:DUF4358 domain-containing protein [Oscillospiraceae bacterium]
MKNRKIVALVLAFASFLSLIACGAEKKADVNGEALMQVILNDVKFDTQIQNVGEDAEMYFSGLPAGAKVQMYTGSGYYADRVALITLEKESDSKAAKDSMDEHVAQLNHQFMNYIPEELDKIEHAVIWSEGKYVLLCVTNDYKKAESIVKNAAEETKNVTVTEPGVVGSNTEASTEAPTQEPTEEVTEAPTKPQNDSYAPITSKSGNYRMVNGVYIVDNKAFENYAYDDKVAADYAKLVNRTAADLAGRVNVYALPIPTAIGIVMPDDIVAKLGNGYTDQKASMEKLFAKMDSGVKTVSAYENLKAHRTEYLYFNTDYHWNGKAAYYAYESWCEAKGVAPYTLDQRELSTFSGFWGGLYQSNTKKDGALTEDTIEAYHPYSKNIDMKITDKNGSTYSWNVIANGDSYSAGSKYCLFAGADNPLTVYTNPDVTDGSVGVIVKESFGNALISYMVDHYSVLYEVDYRYWEGNLAQFCLQVGAKDITFANNMGMIRSAVLVAMLADNV